ncbi:hypothetical protein RCH14_000948 [Massilia sp. MP_M2]|uniref:deaminase domain-containing protein n=1 Tax=Massilia sp. MP_M2 TaxID=3071713 RepID=UPI00319DEC60
MLSALGCCLMSNYRILLDALNNLFGETIVIDDDRAPWRPKNWVPSVPTGLSVNIYDPDLTTTVSQAFVDAVILLGGQVHADRPPGMHNSSRNISQTDLLHIAHCLTDIGNLGRMAFTLGGLPPLLGLECIAPSFKALPHALKDALARADGTIILSWHEIDGDIRLTRDGIVYPNLKPTFDAGGRRHDSEFLLLNLLAQILPHYGNNIEGELILLTERIPCKYCFEVLRQFAATYRRFRCNVVYFYETFKRNPASLINPNLPANIRLYKGAMHKTGADLTRIGSDTPHHALSDHVRKMAESMDASAHVFGRARGTSVTPSG